LPFVGREREVRRLQAVIGQSTGESVARVVMVTGPAGAGKSRLREELLARSPEVLAGAQVWTGSGDPMSSGAPYALLGDALRAPMGLQSADGAEQRRERIRQRVRSVIDPSKADTVAELLGEICGTRFPDDSNTLLRAAR
jgi:eukaryotic-like serine/threonine-protein kinase